MAITITEKAVKEILRVMESQDMKDHALRVGIEGGGCSGFSYKLGFEEKKDANPLSDSVYSFSGLEARVDRKSELYLEGTTIDYHEDLNQRGFVFENPNAKGCCGCGSSFKV